MQISPSTTLLHTLGAVGAAAPAKPVAPKPAAVATPLQAPVRKPVPPQAFAAATPQAQMAKPPANLPRGSLLNITV